MSSYRIPGNFKRDIITALREYAEEHKVGKTVTREDSIKAFEDFNFVQFCSAWKPFDSVESNKDICEELEAYFIELYQTHLSFGGYNKIRRSGRGGNGNDWSEE